MNRAGIKVEFMLNGEPVHGVIPANYTEDYANEWGVDLKTQVVIWFEDEKGKEWRTIESKDNIKILGFSN